MLAPWVNLALGEYSQNGFTYLLNVNGNRDEEAKVRLPAGGSTDGVGSELNGQEDAKREK